MGTKLNPGRFDCHAAALPDEPLFTLLARDPLAPLLVSIWSSLRVGDWEAAEAKYRRSLVVAERYVPAPDIDQAAEALDCSMAMFDWRRENNGAWRQPPTKPRPGFSRRLLNSLRRSLTSNASCAHGSRQCDECYWDMQW